MDERTEPTGPEDPADVGHPRADPAVDPAAMGSAEADPSAVLRLDASGVGAVAAVAVVLSAVSGFVDAVVYLRVAPVFIANQSGNLILEGIALGERRWIDAVLPLASLVGYVAGAALVVASSDRRPAERGSGRRRLRGVLVVEAVLLVLLVGVMLAADLGRRVGPVRPAVTVVVVLAAAAMGAQGVSVRRARGLPVLTTAGSGALTDLGVALGRAVEPAQRRSVPPVVRTIGAVVVAYVGGAVVGALAASLTDRGPELLLAPAVLVLAVLAAESVAHRRA